MHPNEDFNTLAEHKVEHFRAVDLGGLENQGLGMHLIQLKG